MKASKDSGNPNFAATNVKASPESVSFNVPPTTVSGNYDVMLTPGSLAPIPLTVAAPLRPPQGTTSQTPPAAPIAENAPAAPPAPAPLPRREVYMPDGQLESHAVLVYLTHPIELGNQPCLQLTRSHELTKATADEYTCYRPMHVVSGQGFLRKVNGKDAPDTGTLLMFDLSQVDFGLKAMMRVRPVLYWNESGKTQVATGPREVNLGNSTWIFSWTGVVVAAALILIALLSWFAKGNPFYLLIGAEGRLSLAQSQIALWTVAVGAVVFGYGLLRLDMPTIPNSLLALMGASLATGGLAFFGDARKQSASADGQPGPAPAAPVAPAPPARGDIGGAAAAPALARVPAQVAAPASVPSPLALRNLVLAFPPAEGELSLSKAQMIFWTILLVILFVSKSVLDGAIWEVPWALVALMGFSQAGFLVPKFAPDSTTQPQPQPPPQQPVPPKDPAQQ